MGMSGWGATMYFFDVPDIDIDFTGLANIADLPGIKGVIRSVLAEQISKKVVLPNTINLTFGSEDDNASTKLSMGSVAAPMGCLRVAIKKANGIKSGDPDFFGLLKGVQNDNKYITMTLGGRRWKSASIDADMHHALVVNDLRQTLKISVWDEDDLTCDDRLGTAGPFPVREALALNGKQVPLQGGGSLDLGVFWLKATPRQLGNDGAIICIKVSSIDLPLDLGSSAKLTARLDVGSTAGTSKDEETRVVKRSESKFMANLKDLKKMGVSAAEVDKIQNSNPGLLKKMGIITVLYIHANQQELANGTLRLTVNVQKEGDKDAKFLPVGQPWTTPLSKVSAASDKTLKGPMSMGSSIDVDAEIELWGLMPGPCQE